MDASRLARLRLVPSRVLNGRMRGALQGERILVFAQSEPSELELVRRAAQHFASVTGAIIEVQSTLPTMREIRASGFILFSVDGREPLALRLAGAESVSPYRSPLAAWSWHHALSRRTPVVPRVSQGRRTFATHLKEWRTAYSKSYVLGTGPSLDLVDAIDMSDGFRVACNTIVKDAATIGRLRPHVIVAGDAQYHFGETAHARRFMADVRERMGESDFLFVYPADFDAYVSSFLSEYADRCIPIPVGDSRNAIAGDLDRTWLLPQQGNVLNDLLLPIAATVTKDLYLLGFDGRRKDDKLFWRNSTRHSYPELIEEMSGEYTAFYEFFVPAGGQSQYVQKYHGDALAERLSNASSNGYSFRLLSPSASPGLSSLEVVGAEG